MANRRQTRRQRGGIRVSPELEIGVWGVPLVPIPFPYLKADIKVGTSGGGKRRNTRKYRNRSKRSNRNNRKA
jgi:hypothetical protein